MNLLSRSLVHIAHYCLYSLVTSLPCEALSLTAIARVTQASHTGCYKWCVTSVWRANSPSPGPFDYILCEADKEWGIERWPLQGFSPPFLLRASRKGIRPQLEHLHLWWGRGSRRMFFMRPSSSTSLPPQTYCSMKGLQVSSAMSQPR